MVNTYPPSTSCSVLKKFGESLSGQCGGNYFQLLKGTEQVQCVIRLVLCTDGGWPVPTSHHIPKLGIPLLTAFVALKQWQMQIVPALGRKSTIVRIGTALNNSHAWKI